MNKPTFLTAKEAVKLIKNGDTVAPVGYIGMGHAEELTYELEKRFLETGEPRNLTVTWGSSQSNTKDMIGCNRFAHKGFVKRAIVGHMGLQFDLSRMAMDNEFEAYNIPQGVLMHIYRAKGGNKPCVVTHVGLHTYVDPRQTGGRMNDLAIQNGPDYVELINIDGKEYLMYKTFPIDVAIIRATTADEHGNLSMEKEGMLLENLALAYAARASGGIVIAQVERVVRAGALHPQMVKVPGVVVDYVVQCSDPQKFHKQSYAKEYDPSLSGEVKVPIPSVKKMRCNKLDARKIICRRAVFELVPNTVISLGVGIPSEISSIVMEEELTDAAVMTVEPSTIGGIPCTSLEFGCAVNVEALVDHPYQFDFYDGGGLDMAALGMAELDKEGNVNVSKFGSRLYGVGGFINISQNTNTLVFMGTFTAEDLEVQAENGILNILQEGARKKMVQKAAITAFSGPMAAKAGKKVCYITERAVFELTKQGLVLTEIAPGIDLQTQVLDLMEFKPIISNKLKIMDKRIFTDKPMKIKQEILSNING